MSARTPGPSVSRGQDAPGGTSGSWIRGHRVWVRRAREPEEAVFVVRRRLGTAVERNRLKRRLRHIWRLDGGRARVGMVVLAQTPAMGAPFAELRTEVDELMLRL